jgi:hypothetical protein
MQIAEHIWKFQTLNAFNLTQLLFQAGNIKEPVFTKEKSLENESQWIGDRNFLDTLNSCGAITFEWKRLPSLPLTFELKRHRGNFEKYTELLFKCLPTRLWDRNKEETQKKPMFRYSELRSQCFFLHMLTAFHFLRSYIHQLSESHLRILLVTFYWRVNSFIIEMFVSNITFVRQKKKKKVKFIR